MPTFSKKGMPSSISSASPESNKKHSCNTRITPYSVQFAEMTSFICSASKNSSTSSCKASNDSSSVGPASSDSSSASSSASIAASASESSGSNWFSISSVG